MRHLANGARTKDATKKHLAQLIEHYDRHGFSWCALFEKESACFVGLAGLAFMFFDHSHEKIELAYMLDEPFWNKGYATEIARACVSWGFTELKQNKIVAVTHVQNTGSKNVLQKVGFRYFYDMTYSGKVVSYYEIMS